VRLGLTLKVHNKDGTVSMYRRRSKRAFLNLIGSAWGESYYLKVSYGKGLTVNNKIKPLYNEGEYRTKNDLIYALRAFTERRLLDELEEWFNVNKKTVVKRKPIATL